MTPFLSIFGRFGAILAALSSPRVDLEPFETISNDFRGIDSAVGEFWSDHNLPRCRESQFRSSKGCEDFENLFKRLHNPNVFEHALALEPESGLRSAIEQESKKK